MADLTEHDEQAIARARELAGIQGTDEDDPYFAVTAAFGTAQDLLWQLTRIRTVLKRGRPVPDLTESDWQTIKAAREITGVRHRNIREWTGDEDQGIAYTVAFGRAQLAVNGLLDIISRLTAKSDAAFIDSEQT